MSTSALQTYDSDEWDSELEQGDDPLSELDEAFYDFLITDEKGPKLDDATVNLLNKYGLVNEHTLVIFSQFPFDEEMEMFSDEKLNGLAGRYGLRNLRAYGLYLSSNDLITAEGLVNHDGFLPINYAVFRKTQRRNLSRDLKNAHRQEVEVRSKRYHINDSLPPAFTPPDHTTGTTNESDTGSGMGLDAGNVTPSDDETDGGQTPMINNFETPTMRPTAVPSSTPKEQSPFGEPNYTSPEDHDEGSLLYMKDPPDEDFSSPIRLSMSPASGNPTNDPAFS